MIEIREVKTRKEIKRFIEFPLNLYKGNPYFVPPLYMDEKAIFKPDFAYADQTECVYYNAYKDGKIVGRISGIIQLAANKKYNQKRVRFTRFDSIDDYEVAASLFDAVTSWAKERGMTEIVGPLGFSDLEREGLLVEGFNHISTFEEQYNYPYYKDLIEKYGFVKEVGWLEHKLTLPEKIDPRIYEVSDRILKKYKLHIPTFKNINELLKRYQDQFFEILDITYDKIYGTVPFTEKMKEMMVSNFKLIMDLKHVTFIVDENDKVVCFGLCFPSISKAVQKSGGRLTPATIVKILWSLKHTEFVELALIGVLPEYESTGVATAMLKFIYDRLQDKHIKYAETNLNLEDNHRILNNWKMFNCEQHKKRTCYVMAIK